MSKKEWLERNSEQKNWKTHTNTDDFDNPEEFLSLSELGGVNLSKRKDYVRLYVSSIRSHLSESEVEEKSLRISENLTSLECFKSSRTIGLYSHIRNEVRTEGIFARAVESGKEIYFPRVSGESLTFHRVKSMGDLNPGSFGVPEPDPGSVSIEPRNLDLVVVPASAIDPGGNRIGYGKGFYDRLLADIPVERRIGAVYGFQVLDAVPVGEYDQAVGIITTELGVIFCGRLEGGT